MSMRYFSPPREGRGQGVGRSATFEVLPIARVSDERGITPPPNPLLSRGGGTPRSKRTQANRSDTRAISKASAGAAL